MQVEEIFIWEKNERKQSPSSVANQNAGFALVHQLGVTNNNYQIPLSAYPQNGSKGGEVGAELPGKGAEMLVGKTELHP